MLVTRRRAGEAIRIGGDIEIEVLEIGPNWVRLGVKAPRETAVWRREQEAVRDENRGAASAWTRANLDALARRLHAVNRLPLKPADPEPI